jgi:hypothetical protein
MRACYTVHYEMPHRLQPSVTTYKTTNHHNSEDQNTQFHLREDLEFHVYVLSMSKS